MLRSGKFWTAVGLLAMVVVIGAALVIESGSNPTFRPADYGSFEDCVANIPAEWLPGSLEQTGALESCGWVHGRAPR